MLVTMTRDGASEGSVQGIADETRAWLVATQPYHGVRAGVVPDAIPTASEQQVYDNARHAAGLLGRLRAAERLPGDEDLAAILEHLLATEAAKADHLWLEHVAAPYSILGLTLVVDMVIAPLSSDTAEQLARREALTRDFVALVRSIGERLRGQHARGIAAPLPARPQAVATWQQLRGELPCKLTPARSSAALDALLADELPRAVDEVLLELSAGEWLATAQVGLAHLPGGEEAYRACVLRETTLQATPEELHELGLEQCRELAERMAELRGRLGGPADDDEGRAWVLEQPHLYAASPDEVARRYRSVLRAAEPHLPAFFRTLPAAPCDVVRLERAAEVGMSYGFYQPPAPADPVGRYHFNGSGLDQRSQVGAVALILHELAPGHHLHWSRLAEDVTLHPLQRELRLNAFSEGWAEYAAGLGWEMGLYDDDWDAYGRLVLERFLAQRLVVDTAMNLGRWDLVQARDFMRRNTLEGDAVIAAETLRYSTDVPGQALAYRTGFLAFEQARRSAAGADVRDVHEAMIRGGTVPLDHMRRQVAAAFPPAGDEAGASATTTRSG
jgi:uncharacterized protein (DUF885 family)